jgi:hypothetical protein
MKLGQCTFESSILLFLVFLLSFKGAVESEQRYIFSFTRLALALGPKSIPRHCTIDAGVTKTPPLLTVLVDVVLSNGVVVCCINHRYSHRCG